MEGSGSPRARKPKATSCAACRRSKLRCQPNASERCFPCPRCQRLGLPCEDPQKQPWYIPEDDRVAILTKMLKKRFQHNGRLDRGRMLYFFRAFGMMYRHRSSHQKGWSHAKSANYLTIMRVLGEYLGLDPELAIEPRQSGDNEDGAVIEGRLVRYSGQIEDAMHPFLLPLFTDTSSTIGFVNLRGEPRFWVNEAFADAFFTADYANKRCREQSVPPPDVLLEVLHPDEHRRFDKSFHFFCFETEANVTETSQIYKVLLPKSGATVTTLLRVRTVFQGDGEYMAFVFCFTPLPLKPAMHSSASKTTLGSVEVPYTANPFEVFSHAVGLHEEEAKAHQASNHGKKRRVTGAVEAEPEVEREQTSPREGMWGGSAEASTCAGEGGSDPEEHRDLEEEMLDEEEKGLLWETLMASDGPILGEEELWSLVKDQEHPPAPAVTSNPMPPAPPPYVPPPQYYAPTGPFVDMSQYYPRMYEVAPPATAMDPSQQQGQFR